MRSRSQSCPSLITLTGFKKKKKQLWSNGSCSLRGHHRLQEPSQTHLLLWAYSVWHKSWMTSARLIDGAEHHQAWSATLYFCTKLHRYQNPWFPWDFLNVARCKTYNLGMGVHSCPLSLPFSERMKALAFQTTGEVKGQVKQSPWPCMEIKGVMLLPSGGTEGKL